MINLQVQNLLAIPFLLLTQLSCASNHYEKEKSTERTYQVSSFEIINSEIVGNIEVSQAPVTSISAIGDQKLLDNLIVEVEDQKLKLSMKENLRNFNLKRKSAKLTVYISMPHLIKLESEGVGNIRLIGDIQSPELTIQSDGVGNISSDNLKSEYLQIESEGVGNILLHGSSNEMSIHSNGVGNINAHKMIANQVRIKSDGIGNIKCHAVESLDIESSGIGNVTYWGNPVTKNLNKNGIGKIKEGR